MMNTLRGLLTGGKVKQQETAQKELEKVQAQESDLQGQLAQAQSNQAKIQQALTVVEASLVIDENDKQALAQQKKAQSKLDDLTKEIAATQEKLVGVAEKKKEAIRETFRSRGDLARKHNVKVRRDSIATIQFNKLFGLELGDVLGIYTPNKEGINLGEAYGVGDTDSLDPHSEDWKDIVAMNNEDEKQAYEQAEAIKKELQEAIKAVFEKHDIELTPQSVINLNR
ncbi:hypothetical protein ABE47_21040 [Bacillus thuringiensis]|nr:hypothetical protein [Bacillus thuringiensis]